MQLFKTISIHIYGGGPIEFTEQVTFTLKIKFVLGQLSFQESGGIGEFSVYLLNDMNIFNFIHIVHIYVLLDFLVKRRV